MDTAPGLHIVESRRKTVCQMNHLNTMIVDEGREAEGHVLRKTYASTTT